MTEPVVSQQEKTNSIEDIKGKIANVSSEKRWAMSCYIPVINLFTCVLTAVKMVNSKFCRFHSRQGLMVFGIWAVATLIGIISPTLSLMLLGVFLVLCVSGMIIAYSGAETSIPVIGQFAQKIPEYYIFKLLTGKLPEQEDASGVKDGAAAVKEVEKKQESVQNSAKESETDKK